MDTRPPNQILLAEIEAFLERHGMAPTRFGSRAMSDPTFVFELRQGKDVKSSTIVRARQWMEGYRPLKSRKRVVGNVAAA